MRPSGLDVDRVRQILREHRFLPDSAQAVFVGGSMARGWQHARSDADVYVVSTTPWQGEANGFNSAGVGSIPTNATYLDGRCWELRYWLDGQVDQALAKVGWDQFEHIDPTAEKVSSAEAALLGRIGTALIIEGADWIRHRREQVASSAFRTMFTLRFLSEADSCAENARGMLEGDDLHAAVLAAHMALGHAVDALTANHGEYSFEGKWRAHRMMAVNPTVLSFERYWELATMRSFDRQNPEAWVNAVLSLCREVALAVEI